LIAATLLVLTACGGPETPPGTSRVAMTRGGNTLRSMTVAVSGGGFGTCVTSPFAQDVLRSFDETAI